MVWLDFKNVWLSLKAAIATKEIIKNSTDLKSVSNGYCDHNVDDMYKIDNMKNGLRFLDLITVSI